MRRNTIIANITITIMKAALEEKNHLHLLEEEDKAIESKIKIMTTMIEIITEDHREDLIIMKNIIGESMKIQEYIVNVNLRDHLRIQGQDHIDILNTCQGKKESIK